MHKKFSISKVILLRATSWCHPIQYVCECALCIVSIIYTQLNSIILFEAGAAANERWIETHIHTERESDWELESMKENEAYAI